MDPLAQLQLLGRKQLAIQEGIDLLRGLQIDLSDTRSSADAWGATAVLANFTLIPLNVVINAFELKGAGSLYQRLVLHVYQNCAQSGTRLDGIEKVILSSLKKAIVDELRRKSLSDFVPGVNILIGLVEDSRAAWRSVKLVESGRHEISSRAADINRRIDVANRQLVQLGIKRANLFGRLQVHARTA
jgi:hypothetical protein